MAIPTLSADKILTRINNKIGSYPANSLSKREVVAEVPISDDPDQFAKLDAKVSTALWSDAQAAIKRNGGQPYKVVAKDELERVTGVVVSACK